MLCGVLRAGDLANGVFGRGRPEGRKCSAARQVAARASPSPDFFKKAAQLRQAQQAIEQEMAELAQSAAQLSGYEQSRLEKLMKGEEDYVDMPDSVKAMLSEAGVLDAVPSNGQTPPEPSSFIQPKPPTFDWTNPDLDPSFPENQDSGEAWSDRDIDQYLAEKIGNARATLAQDDRIMRQLFGGGESDGESDGEVEGEVVGENDGEMGGGGEIVDLKQWERGLPQEPEEGSEKDEEFVPGDEQQFAIGQGVDEALHLMAEGGTLPPDPAMQGRVPESADSFRARMHQLTARYESQFLRRKDWEIASEEIREMDRQWQETPWDAKIALDYEDITEPVMRKRSI